MRDARLAVLPVLLVAGMLLTGVAFAHWSESLLLTGSVATGSLDWRFFTVGHLDPGPPNTVMDYHCRDNFEGSTYWQGDKDVGYTRAVITEDPHVIEVTLNNVYPSYFNSISVYMKNTGTVPLIIEKAIINGTVVMDYDTKVRLDLNNDGENDLEIWWRANIFGVQLEPGKDSPQTSFWVHVLQGAPRGASLHFTIELVAVQWNFSEYKPTIGLSPQSLTFQATAGGPNPPPQTVTISNTGGGTLCWTATDDATWLSLNPTSGALAAGASKNITVSVDITGLTAGTYHATITVSAPNATNSPQTVDVTLVIEPPIISVNLHPNYAVDATDGPVPLSSDNLAKLTASDDDRYITLTGVPYAGWNPSGWGDYLDFEFENIPAGATVQSVVLKFEWQRPSTGVTNARLQIYVGASQRGENITLSLPPAGVDNIVTLNLYVNPYSINTASEVNNLRVRFQAQSSSPFYPTLHDWVEVQVTYTV